MIAERSQNPSLGRREGPLQSSHHELHRITGPVDEGSGSRLCKVGVNVREQTAVLELIGGDHMTEQQFSIILFHLRAILGLVGIQASVMLGFAWKFL